MDDHDPHGGLVRLLREVTGQLDLADARFAARNDLHPTDLRALHQLLDARRGGVPATPGWLSARLGLNSASVTALVDRLVRGGYVTRTRDAHDRRRVLLSVRDKALALGCDTMDAELREALGACTAEDLAATGRVLRQAQAVLGRTGRGRPSGVNSNSG